MPTTRSTARERRSSSAGRRLALEHLDQQVGRASASRSSTPGSRASAGVCTNVIRRRPRGASTELRELGQHGLVGRERRARRARPGGSRPASARRCGPTRRSSFDPGLALQLRRAGRTRKRGCRRAPARPTRPCPRRESSNSRRRRRSSIVRILACFYVGNRRLKRTDDLTEADGMLFVSLLIAPRVMAAAALAERRLGPSAAGWVAALRASFAVALIAVAIDSGRRAGRRRWPSARRRTSRPRSPSASPSRRVLTRHGMLAGLVSGALADLTGSLALADVPGGARRRPRPSGARVRPPPDRPTAARESPSRTWGSVAMTCLVASVDRRPRRC